ncbi:MAG: class II aldolase/adducin family protein [Hyphomicrobiaceae bacterium]
MAKAGTKGSAGAVPTEFLEDLVASSRILAQHGVLDAFGHVSVRHPADPNRYLLSRNLAPELVTAGDIVEYDLDSEPVDPKAPRGFLERYIHGEIYKSRPDVGSVIHTHSPSVVPFGVTQHAMRPIYHMSGFLGRGVPVYDIRKESGRMTDILVREPEHGRDLARVLADKPMALMRGHGNVVVAQDVKVATYRAVYTEMNARLQLQAMLAGGPIEFLSPEEALLTEATIEGQIHRPWGLWKSKVMGTTP